MNTTESGITQVLNARSAMKVQGTPGITLKGQPYLGNVTFLMYSLYQLLTILCCLLTKVYPLPTTDYKPKPTSTVPHHLPE